ncbi:MAG: glycosyl transferase family 2 [uncultured bacterium]|nr:MAG: glycosyl transferase family 2 [uncultured bacterium]
MDGKSSLEKEKCTEEDARAKRELGISERDIESALVTNQKNQNKIITNKEIDVFIISYNRVTYLKTLVSWLEKAGFEKIHIVDNNSTYPPLLEYLKSSKHNVHKMRKNYGHLVVWESGEFDEILNNKYYIVSDCDVVPIDDCPMEITSYFFQILQKYNEVTKVGFSLKIDDLPEHFIFRDSVVDWEKQFWNKRRGEGLFDAPIDTTFALYRPGIYPSDNAWWNSIRTYYPYMAKHTPWYANTYEPSEEDIYYQGEIKNRSSFWSTTDIDALNMYYKDLLLELKGVYASRRWKFLRILYKSRSIFTGKNIPGEYRKIELLISDNKNAKELQEKNKDFAVALGNIYSDPLWKILQNIEDMRTRFSVKKYSNFIMHGKMRQPLRQIYYAIRFKKIK